MGEEINKRKISVIAKGLLISFVISLIFILILTAYIMNNNISDEQISTIIIIINAISILIGTTIATRKVEKNGIINGLLISGIYIGIIYLISSYMYGFGINIKSLILIITSMIIGAIGGIIGINIKK